MRREEKAQYGDPDPLSAGTAGDAVARDGSMTGWGWRRTRAEPTMPAGKIMNGADIEGRSK